jgi:hypothetical protein
LFSAGRRRHRSYLDTAHDTNSNADIDISNCSSSNAVSTSESTSNAPSIDCASHMIGDSTNTNFRPSSSRGKQTAIAVLQNGITTSTAAESVSINDGSNNSEVHDDLGSAYNAADNDGDDVLSIALAQSRLR